MPTPRKPDQSAPAAVSPTGATNGQRADADPRAQSGQYLTTAQGLRLPDTDHSLKAGDRGPTLLEDFHLREKITHFDHERIPERVVHARGAAAHGVFVSYGTAASITKAGFLGKKGTKTEVFTRFSTVLGSRGSADTVRDTRGFAVKFYTDGGTFDLVGNNMPVFFIQDGIKFPDIIHAAKPHPDREIPQAQSAHDTFWDFVSLHTEATHHVFWNMSDRGIPRSFRTMEGFGVHTFRLVNDAGETNLVKFHWKPLAGVHSLVWEEAQIAAGCDPDFHRRDMADGIEAGTFFEYELGVQVMPDDGSDSFEGIDLLDPTKLVPEELAPVQLIGKMTLNRNPTNYFAETEQVAFHTGNLVPGIEATNDPLMQARLFSYLDTQITRLGGPNFAQLPINRPHCPVNDMLRDGMHQTAVHTGLAPYHPNSIDGDEPLLADNKHGGYVQMPRPIEGTAVRAQPVSFDDHFSQATMFYRSLSLIEQTHVVEAFTFELGKVYEQAIKERELQVLANVDSDLCEQVAGGLGLPAPKGKPAQDVVVSPALVQILAEPGPIDGRKIGIIADAGSDLAGVAALIKAAEGLGVTALVIAPVGGVLNAGRRKITADRTLATARSIEFDALVVAGGTTPSRDIKLVVLLQEAFRHCKTLAAWGDGAAVLKAAGISVRDPGVEVSKSVDKAFTAQLAAALGLHRVWDRAPKVMASAIPSAS
ncbi:MAG TPA: catalase [Mycobacterium sp.]|nr:catalase [Mycobacterium sp.]